MKQYLTIGLIVGTAFLLAGCVPDRGYRSGADHHYRSPAKHHGPNTDVARCIRDNADADVSRSVVRRYCECMDGKMSEHDRRSISRWEQTHPRAMAECERRSGWR